MAEADNSEQSRQVSNLLSSGAGALTGFLPAEIGALTAPRSPDLLGDAAQDALDRVARLVAMVLDAPFASVTFAGESPLADGARTGAVGWAAAEWQVSAERPLHQYVIESDDRLIIEDIRQDLPSMTRRPLAAAGVVAWAGLPVRRPDGHVVGAISVADCRPRRWTGHEVQVLTALAHVAASQVALGVAVDDGSRPLVPPGPLPPSPAPVRLPAIPGLQIAASCSPAQRQLVGAFYDVLPSVGGRWGLVVGDIRGPNAPTARSALLARQILRVDTGRQARPSEILAGLNVALLGWRATDRPLVTAICAIVRPGLAGTAVQVSAAGRPRALVRRADGTVHVLGRPGNLLGLRPDAELHDRRRLLRSGDSLILVNDGVAEARSYLDPDASGDDRLREVVAGLNATSAARTADAILQATRESCGGQIGEDAVALVLKVPGGKPGLGTHAAAWPGTYGYRTGGGEATGRGRPQSRHRDR